jgi:enamine deaminase RidA (YjgF/YER057c/UK114 family)
MRPVELFMKTPDPIEELSESEAADSDRFHMEQPAPCAVPAPCGLPCSLKLGPERHSSVDLGALARTAIMIEPSSRGSFTEQAEELFAQLHCLACCREAGQIPTSMMVFLRDAADEEECRKIVAVRFREKAPVVAFVAQPPCSGAALGVELWAVGGPGVEVKRFGPQVISVESNGIRWVHVGGVYGDATGPDEAHEESATAFRHLNEQLELAGVDFGNVIRTWIYVNQITEGSEGQQRYQELNRARTDFFEGFRLCGKNRASWAPETIYPASTGIGTQGKRIVLNAVALQSDRPDVFFMPLENPQQISSFDYHARYSPKTPKFARAMAIIQGHFVTTMVSGTASIVDQTTVHIGDVAKQTEQTIENIEQLIGEPNFAQHNMPGVGATLKDIAKLRVYVKHAEDYEKCREIVEQKLPAIPAIYLHADVCRPDLLVEIEAVAFSPLT